MRNASNLICTIALLSKACESAFLASTTTSSTRHFGVYTNDAMPHSSFPAKRRRSSKDCLLLSSPNSNTDNTNTHNRIAHQVNADAAWNDNIPKYFYIPEELLDMQFTRSGGSGGQNVNKVSSQVQIKLHVRSADWIPLEVRSRLMRQQANRISKEGTLLLTSSEHRTQSANRKSAVDKLRKLILQAWVRPKQRNMRTGISYKTKQRRKDDKRKRGQVKQRRKSVGLE